MEDSALLSLLRSRDERGMEQLLKRYGSLIRYVVGGILQDPQETEDCCSEVSLCLWQKIDAYDPEKASLATWLTAVSRNMALNHRKALHRRSIPQSEGEAVTEQTPEDEVLRKEQLRQLQELIRCMDPTDRQLFYRKYYYMQPMAQIAAEMGLSLRAAEGRLYRLRQWLRRELGGDAL